MNTTQVKFKVLETSIKGQSLLVLPDPVYNMPQLSLQMRTTFALRLAYSANVLPELADAAEEFLTSILTIGGANNKTIKRLQDALSAAQWT